MESKSNTLAFFGCWGDKGNKTSQCNPVTNHIKDTDYSAVIIAGDNYYVDKRKVNGDKYKYFNVEEVENIFNCLPIDKPIYMLTGNHEYDVLKKKKSIFNGKDFNDENQFDECAVLKEELNQVGRRQLQPATQIYFDTIKFNNHMIKNGVLFLFIDSTMYEYNPTDSLKCYDVLLGEDSSNLLELRQRQQEILHRVVQMTTDEYKSIVMCAHHPLIIFRKKTKKEKITREPIKFNKPLLDLVRVLGTGTDKITYLCADFHVYQHCLITLPELIIDHHVVGTGGTELDELLTVDEIQTTEIPEQESPAQEPEIGEHIQALDTEKSMVLLDGINVQLLGGIVSDGLLEVTIDDSDVECNFISLSSPNGGRKSRRKRKRARRTRRYSKYSRAY